MAMQQITLNIPKKLYQQAQRLAKQRNQAVDELLVESIVLDEETAENPFDLDLDIEQRRMMAQEEAAFLRLHPVLWQQYPGEYVAIRGGQLVDHDTNLATLYIRVKQKYPNQFVWISPVKQEATEQLVFRSPRLVGDG